MAGCSAVATEVSRSSDLQRDLHFGSVLRATELPRVRDRTSQRVVTTPLPASASENHPIHHGWTAPPSQMIARPAAMAYGAVLCSAAWAPRRRRLAEVLAGQGAGPTNQAHVRRAKTVFSSRQLWQIL